MGWLLTHGDYMAGLSSVMAITRPLGEVNLAAMNRCAGIYRVYLAGGGGGGGGYDDFYKWYGGVGGYGTMDAYNRSLVPPITLSTGAGGSAAAAPNVSGQQGGTTSVGDSRVVSIISASGGYGGASATTEQSLSPTSPQTLLATVTSRFTVDFSYTAPSTPYFTVPIGRGGGSQSPGMPGGIIKAFRIG